MESEGDPHLEFEKTFSKQHAGYVLITCGGPSETGHMKVSLTYGGSISLAHMLLDGAQSYLDQEDECEFIEEEVPKLKIHES